MFNKKTIRDIDVGNKRVLVSVDYNVPGDSLGKVTGKARIEASLPTLRYLLEHNAAICLISHRGRPGGKVARELSLRPVAEVLSHLLKHKVMFVDSCWSEAADKAKQELQPGQIVLLENNRFHPEEEANDEEFARKLAEHMDFFVQDGFGNASSRHISLDAVTHYLPSVAGFLVEKEVSTINEAMENPKRPLMALIGGVKISDKIDILNRFIDSADIVAIGGAMANTFLLAEGIKIGKSLADSEDVIKAREILAKARKRAKEGNFVFYIPQDGVVAKEMDPKSPTRIVDWGTHVIAEIQDYPKRPRLEASLVGEDEKILDIGPFSGAFIAGCMQLAHTVIWNGGMGVTEIPGLQSAAGPFSHGTELVVEAMLGQFGNRPHSIVGGGDTISYIESKGLLDQFDHVSTGGRASMILLSGKTLPGVEALQDK